MRTSFPLALGGAGTSTGSATKPVDTPARMRGGVRDRWTGNSTVPGKSSAIINLMHTLKLVPKIGKVVFNFFFLQIKSMALKLHKYIIDYGELWHKIFSICDN